MSAAVALGLAAASPAAAQSPLAAAECGKGAPNEAECFTLPVPLDHSGRVPGTVGLKLARVPAAQPKIGTLVVLTGGPGEAAVPLSDAISGTLGAGAGAYDKIFVDQRGTGGSDAVKCGSVDKSSEVVRCAEELGARRAFWTTRETALDLEDVRLALGDAELTLFGISYGTAVAEEYARRFPATTNGLILDSPVPVDGQDIFTQLLSLGLPRVLKEVCWPPSCRDFAPDPVAALRALVRRVEKRPLRGSVVMTDGSKRRTRLNVDDLYGMIASSDTDPILRAELPAAITSAVAGDAAPILRLLAGLKADGGSSGVNTARLLATNCVEGRLPWAPDSPLESRTKAVDDFVANTAPGTFAPFGPKVAFRNSLAAACLVWPSTPRPEGVPAQGPAVPVLVLSGREDLRTPLEDARRTASRYPGARVLAVPNIGHAVLANDTSDCARDGITAFLAGQPVENCDRSKLREIQRAPFIPATVGDLAAPKGLPKRVGRTATAVLVTLLEINRAAALRGKSTGGGDTLRVPGLRGGTARLGENTFTLRAFEVVRGVRVSGTVGRRGTLTVTAPRGIRGTFAVRGSRLRGTLGGEPVVIRVDE